MFQYKADKTIDPEQIAELFSSVGWSRSKGFDGFAKSLKQSDNVVSCWFENELVGLTNALSDGCRTAYIHYVLVKPLFQNRGIGQKMIERLLVNYRKYSHIVLISCNEATGFFEKCGFVEGNAKPMNILVHWTHSNFLNIASS